MNAKSDTAMKVVAPPGSAFNQHALYCSVHGRLVRDAGNDAQMLGADLSRSHFRLSSLKVHDRDARAMTRHLHCRGEAQTIESGATSDDYDLVCKKHIVPMLLSLNREFGHRLGLTLQVRPLAGENVVMCLRISSVPGLDHPAVVA